MSSDVPLLIYDVSIQLINYKKALKSIDLSIGGEDIQAQWEDFEANVRKVTFSAARTVLPAQSLALRIHFKKIYHPRQDIVVTRSELISEAPRGNWQKTYDKTQVTVGFQSGASQLATGTGDDDTPARTDPTRLLPTTQEILRLCPRFRILVIGKTGVGKSSLINKSFGVTDANVSHSAVGTAEIDKEILSKTNDKFVLHDSRGLEPGEVETFEIVQDFIRKRDMMPAIKDKLHAVWLCLEIPTTGNRLETGVEHFLQLKQSGQLGKVPVIGVFTKYDKLITRLERTMDPSRRANLTKERLSKVAEEDAENALKNISIDPFEAFEGSVDREEVPLVHVSTNPGREATLLRLIQLTYDNVYKYLETPSIVTAMAQKVNPSVNIDASIAVGKRRYWLHLASSVNFPGKDLKSCLEVIHTDIISVWNFKDDHEYLSSPEFKALMSNLVSNEQDANIPNPHRTIMAGIPMVSAIAGLISVFSGIAVAAPIVIPIVGCFILAKWAYDIYDQSTIVLCRLMTYIIDLTLVMQNIFWFQEDVGRPLTRRLIKFAVAVYSKSAEKRSLHQDIDEHVKDKTVFSGRDVTLDKVIELIGRHRIDSAEMFKHRDKIAECNLGGDEEWDAPVQYRSS